MVKVKELLMFKEVLDEVKHKTKVFGVYSNHSKELLGYIHWLSSWRCYIISYENNISMSLSCNKELDAFMEKLEEERKNV